MQLQYSHLMSFVLLITNYLYIIFVYILISHSFSFQHHKVALSWSQCVFGSECKCSLMWSFTFTVCRWKLERVGVRRSNTFGSRGAATETPSAIKHSNVDTPQWEQTVRQREKRDIRFCCNECMKQVLSSCLIIWIVKLWYNKSVPTERNTMEAFSKMNNSYVNDTVTVQM